VQVNYRGALITGEVGDHTVRADVEKLVDGAPAPVCIVVNFKIEDGEALRSQSAFGNWKVHIFLYHKTPAPVCIVVNFKIEDGEASPHSQRFSSWKVHMFLYHKTPAPVCIVVNFVVNFKIEDGADLTIF
jgi:hypothetical protein